MKKFVFSIFVVFAMFSFCSCEKVDVVEPNDDPIVEEPIDEPVVVDKEPTYEIYAYRKYIKSGKVDSLNVKRMKIDYDASEKTGWYNIAFYECDKVSGLWGTDNIAKELCDGWKHASVVIYENRSFQLDMIQYKMNVEFKPTKQWHLVFADYKNVWDDEYGVIRSSRIMDECWIHFTPDYVKWVMVDGERRLEVSADYTYENRDGKNADYYTDTRVIIKTVYAE